MTSRLEAAHRAAQISADACARVLETLFGQSVSHAEVTVDEVHENVWKRFDYPAVAVEVALVEGVSGENYFVLTPRQGAMLAAAMMGLPVDDPGEVQDLDEIQLSAVAEAMNQMMGAVSTDLAHAIGTPTDIAPPRTIQLMGVEDAVGFGPTSYVASFTLVAGPLEARIVQLISEEYAGLLERVFGASDTAAEVLADRHELTSASDDETLSAVDRTARITAESSATVLTTIFGREVTATLPTIEPAPDDPFAKLAYPLVTIEVSYVSGVNGSNLFALSPEQAATLAAAMMQQPDLVGDGLSELELSAVAEAMNQMMGSATNVLADTLSMAIEVAPPFCKVVSSAEEAQALFGEAAFAARFRIVSDKLRADVVQLVPAEFAEHLRQAFAHADLGRAAATSSEAAAMIGHANTTGVLSGDPTYDAVDRTARITAESAAGVLATIFQEEVTATLPAIEPEPDDPLARLSYPLVTVEVSYVSGVNGANLFALSPEQAATLAAAMMGLDEPMGDGLSELELSAVAEAMNQMMGSATNVLADTLTMAIEVAPPTCKVVETLEEARALFGEAAFAARFRIVAERLTADVVQLVPADFAEHLRRAFESVDLARHAVAGETAPGAPLPAQAAAAAGVPAAPAPGVPLPATAPLRAEVRPGYVDPESLRSVKVRVSAELGRSRLPIERVVNLPPGSIVELDRAPHETIDVLVNGRPFATARLVVVDGEYAVQIVSLAPARAAA